MRRDARRKMEMRNFWEDRKVIVSGGIVIVSICILIVAILYARNNNLASKNELEQGPMFSVVPDDEIDQSTESASSLIGNKVGKEGAVLAEDVGNNATTNTTTEAGNTTDTNMTAEANANTKITNSAKESANIIANNKADENSNSTKNTSSNPEKETLNQKFEWPVKGDVIKAYSVDNLLFSSTLQEWTIHNGIDIKADKSAVVCSSADGTVRSIKNDPRYGLTVIIDHSSGLKTVYSNLLTTEFVVEGEKVSAGQAIGTVGNTANFEIADDFHLHFEVLKDDDYVDPMLYLK